MARINPRLAREGRPLLRTFLDPLLRSHDGFGGLGHVQAEIEHFEWPAHRQYAERYARMLRPGGPFPEPSTLWRLGAALQKRHPWCAQPLLLLGTGHLVAFIDVFSDGAAGLETIRASELLETSVAAIEGDSAARDTWILTAEEARNFRDPQQRAMIARVNDDRLLMARQIAVIFDVSYERRRQAVLDYLSEWLLTETTDR